MSDWLACEQVQIFTRDGAFVRKFGATVLQHPRGVTVDFRGRIVVVECKVCLEYLRWNNYGSIWQIFPQIVCCITNILAALFH